jgi:hypothetical protein
MGTGGIQAVIGAKYLLITVVFFRYLVSHDPYGMRFHEFITNIIIDTETFFMRPDISQSDSGPESKTQLNLGQ